MGCLTRRPALRAGGTLRAGAGGSDKLGSGAALHDGGAHESDGTRQVPEDEPRIEAEDAVAGTLKLGGAALIGSAFESVAAAIYLDDEADAVSEEVDDVALEDDDLTAEHDAELSSSARAHRFGVVCDDELKTAGRDPGGARPPRTSDDFSLLASPTWWRR